MKNKPTYLKRLAFLFGLLLSLSADIFAQKEHTEEISVKPALLYFRFDKALVDSGYMDNGRTLRRLDELFSDSIPTARIDSIYILSFASPEGVPSYNNRLAMRRSHAVRNYLIWKYPHLDKCRILPCPQGENWQELRRMIAEDANLPKQKEVLQIIDCTPETEKRKAQLKKLDNGIPYHYIRQKILRYLRNASICTVKLYADTLPALPEPVCVKPEYQRQEPYAHNLPNPLTEETRRTMEQVRQQEQLAKNKRPLFALKTNLLFDVAMMPNIEIEVPIGKRWSINGEYMFPWWLFDGDKYSMQILMGGLEGRYWLGSHQKRENSEVLTGHFFGLYAGGGKYDLQWKENGYQGEFFIAAGVSYGWATRIARNLHLEFNIGIGMLRTDYRHYHARDNYQTLLWQENGKYTWFGPTKAKLSLVWLLNRKVRKGGIK